MNGMTLEEAKQVGGSPMFAAMRQLSEDGTYRHLDARFMAAHWGEIWDALLVSLARIEALEPLAAYGERQLQWEYDDEAGIEGILSATRGIPSAHRSFESFMAERLAALAAKTGPPR